MLDNSPTLLSIRAGRSGGDPHLQAGEVFDDVIETALQEAKCVFVIWSKRSVESLYIKAEARYALNRCKLVPVAIEVVDLPFRFEDIHTPQLLEWDGSESNPVFQNIVRDITAILGQSPAAEEQGKAEAENKNYIDLPSAWHRLPGQTKRRQRKSRNGRHPRRLFSYG